MIALLGQIAAVTVPLVLLGAAAGRLGRPGALPAALRAHRVLPGRRARPVAAAATAAEALLGVLGAAWADRPGLLRVALAAAAVLLVAYALYGALVLARAGRPAPPCGCGPAGTPLTGWVVGRAGALAALAAVGAARPPGWGPETPVALLAGVSLAVLLWTLPHAMNNSMNDVTSTGRAT
ncbi:MauE/DoxX family redox-associated membrane protein [Actinomadura craniellae]|uniref:MauE/DoxX family redox-associated membrane protein n=1 Tax=Actinomadura craniellae TaxID=2231787 RepID=UPI001314499A|nr:MauE/DoxX family redox-associated membrane protein [Actinomadura craniellae]